MKLRDYQSRTVSDVLSDAKRVVIASPTGSGKTTMGAAISSKYASVCWVAHRAELVGQARESLDRWAPDTLRTVVTVQSVNRPSRELYDLLIVDECHHYAAEDWQNVLTNVKHERLVGLSATPQRADGKGLKGIFDRIVVSASYSELLGLGYLCPCRITAGPKEFEGLSCQPLQAWRQNGENALTLAFAPTILLAEKWCHEFNESGIPSACVFGKTVDRDQILQSFRDGQTRVVWNVSVLTEGFDVPAVGCILLARTVGNAGLYVQITGRGLRPVEGKEHLRLIDLCGNWRVHGYPTQNWEYSLEGKAIRKNKVDKLRQCLKCGAVAIAWVRECPECKYVTPMRRMKLKIDSQELLEVYDGENTPVEAKDVELERLRDEQRKLGRTLQWTIGRYKKLFGRVPMIRDATPQEKAKYYQGLTFGISGPGAAYAYKAVFGHWPPRNERTPRHE